MAFYGNVLVNTAGSAISIQPHNDRPKRIRIFHNTIIAAFHAIQCGSQIPS